VTSRTVFNLFTGVRTKLGPSIDVRRWSLPYERLFM